MSTTASTRRSLSGYASGDVIGRSASFGKCRRSFRRVRERVLERLSPSCLGAMSVAALCSAIFRIRAPLVSNLLREKACLFMNSPGIKGDFVVTRLTCRVDANAPL